MVALLLSFFENRKGFYRKDWVRFQGYVLFYVPQNAKKVFFRHSHVYFHLNNLPLPSLIESIFKLQLIAIKNWQSFVKTTWIINSYK